MSWPLSQDYNEAIQDLRSSIRDAELRQGEAVTNALGIPMPRSGNFADVYEVRCPGGARWAVKCFTREVSGLRERYTEISRALAAARLPFTVEFTYLEEGILVRSKWYPLLKMQWVEGFTFNEFVRNNLDKPAMLDGLLTIWAKMGQRLRSEGIAHADLQHGNVLLVPGSTANALAVKLIDYDGMYVRSLAGKPSGEVGHPCYQHPQRAAEGVYGPEVDRFPLLLIAAALRCLRTGGKELWTRYDNGDNLLFRENDLKAPSASALFRQLEGIADPKARTLVDAVRRALAAPLDKTPLLEEVLPELGAQAHKAAPVSKPVPVSVGAHGNGAKGSPAAPAGVAAAKSFAFDESPTGKASSRRERARARKGSPLFLWAGIGALLIVGIAVALFFGTRSDKNKTDNQALADARPGDTRTNSTGTDHGMGKDYKKDTPKDPGKNPPKDTGKNPPKDPPPDPVPDPVIPDPVPDPVIPDPKHEDKPMQPVTPATFTGTFTGGFEGYTETWTITFADDKWDISGIYTKPGVQDASFTAEDIKYMDGKLTFTQKLGPNCPALWVTGAKQTVEVKDEKSLTYVWDNGIRKGYPRTLVRSTLVVGQPKEPVQPVTQATGFESLFNGKDLTGWSVDGGEASQWTVAENALVGQSKGWRTRNYLLTRKDYADFVLRFEYKVQDGTGGAVAIRAIEGEKVPQSDNTPFFDHPMLKLTNPAPGIEPTGTSHWLKDGEIGAKPVEIFSLPGGVWRTMEVTVRGNKCTATVDGKALVDVTLDPNARKRGDFVPGLQRGKGRVGFQIQSGTVLYRNVEIKELTDANPVVTTPDVPANATMQQRKEAIAKAREIFEAATKKAREDLVAALDREIANLPNAKLSAELRLSLLAAHREEKAAFEKSGTIPWSPAMRPAVTKYLHTRAAAERQLQGAYSKICDQLVKTGDEKMATDLVAEKKKILEPKPVGCIDCTGTGTNNKGQQWKYWLFSNGKLSAEPNERNTWEFVETNRIVITIFLPNSKIIDTITIDTDGKTFTAKNQFNVTYRGTFIP